MDLMVIVSVVERRLDSIYSVTRKYGGGHVDDVLAYLEQILKNNALWLERISHQMIWSGWAEKARERFGLSSDRLSQERHELAQHKAEIQRQQLKISIWKGEFSSSILLKGKFTRGKWRYVEFLHFD